MTTKEKATAIFQKYYEQWESDESRMENGYQYEFSYIEMMKKVQKEVLESSTGIVPKGKNGKKNCIPNVAK